MAGCLQGMSLDCVEISLSRVFECGQAYVALSRARSLHGLRVIDFSASCVRADPDVVRYYREMGMVRAGYRPQGDRPQGDRPQGDRPQGHRPPANGRVP